MKAINKTLWVSGLVTGALVGAYLYKNQDQYASQKEKINGLLGDLQQVAGELKNKLVEASQEGLNATKTALNSAKESANSAKEAVKEKV
ncbi:hypothetical protein [Algoriphagus machipongonensis]|uniref:YtxH domain-containing protein n=1 Tax=Algoriphagus machipongonensis TaxID=388413 RepID=A3HS25_9BACT|nr:hypothetical protein [Algoriphagus machipongonensis]EAZ82643.1 hypothetical protein ALPR1_10520 [Algoriphagus machipongonensis]